MLAKKHVFYRAGAVFERRDGKRILALYLLRRQQKGRAALRHGRHRAQRGPTGVPAADGAGAARGAGEGVRSRPLLQVATRMDTEPAA